jgi:pimeloyl-ACP methyl ester carboxylesterase
VRRLPKLLAAGAALAVPAALNARLARRAPPQPEGLPGEPRYFPWTEGYVRYVVDGDGPPLVLVHGVYPGASAREWRRILPLLTRSRRVYVPDLLGFGLSDRPRISYDPRLYEALLAAFLDEAVREPAAVCACSLSGAFAVHTAFQRPDSVTHLALVSPTGIYAHAEPPGTGRFLLHRTLRLPVLGLSAHNASTRRAPLARWLQEGLGMDPEALGPAELSDLYAEARQPGAAWALAAFRAGLLDEPVERVLPDLRAPVLLLWGRRARLAPFEGAGGFVTLRPTTELETFARSGDLPHVEEAEAFAAALVRWLNA